MKQLFIKQENNVINARVEKGYLLIEGVVNNEYKKLRYYNNIIVNNHLITEITENNVSTCKNGTMFVSCINTFILNNVNTECLIRVERNGLGPYRQKEKTKKFEDWLNSCQINRNKELYHSLPISQPTPYEDSLISKNMDYPHLIKFAFSSHCEMFSWFPLKEIQFLLSEGFKIIVLQQGIDYFKSYKGDSQVCYVETESNFIELERRKASIFF